MIKILNFFVNSDSKFSDIGVLVFFYLIFSIWSENHKIIFIKLQLFSLLWYIHLLFFINNIYRGFKSILPSRLFLFFIFLINKSIIKLFCYTMFFKCCLDILSNNEISKNRNSHCIIKWYSYDDKFWVLLGFKDNLIFLRKVRDFSIVHVMYTNLMSNTMLLEQWAWGHFWKFHF